jgi:hypothetical protein
MNIAGLSGIHEEALKEINRTIDWVICHEDIHYVQQLIQNTFGILKESAKKYPDTVLKSVLNMGMGVYKTDESDLVSFSTNRLSGWVSDSRLYGNKQRLADPEQFCPYTEHPDLDGIDQAESEVVKEASLFSYHPSFTERRSHQGYRPVPEGYHRFSQQRHQAGL